MDPRMWCGDCGDAGSKEELARFNSSNARHSLTHSRFEVLPQLIRRQCRLLQAKVFHVILYTLRPIVMTCFTNR